jgi:hypothetical protein
LERGHLCPQDSAGNLKSSLNSSVFTSLRAVADKDVCAPGLKLKSYGKKFHQTRKLKLFYPECALLGEEYFSQGAKNHEN